MEHPAIEIIERWVFSTIFSINLNADLLFLLRAVFNGIKQMTKIATAIVKLIKPLRFN